jgi:hypothetical protein
MTARRAAKVDSNQMELVRFMRKLGASVAITSSSGEGFTDTVVGFCGMNRLVEIKDGDKPASKRVLTPDQREWHMKWGGSAAVIDNEVEALELLIALAEQGELHAKSKQQALKFVKAGMSQ